MLSSIFKVTIRNTHYLHTLILFQSLVWLICLMAYPYLPTPPLGQVMTQGQFLSEV